MLAFISEQSIKLGSHRLKDFSLTGKSLCRLIQALCTIGCELEDAQASQKQFYIEYLIFFSQNSSWPNSMISLTPLWVIKTREWPNMRSGHFPH
jgi:hypothetical protein